MNNEHLSQELSRKLHEAGVVVESVSGYVIIKAQ